MINYYLLTKPGIVLGNLVTLAAGFLLASKGVMDIRFLQTILGLAFIMASACVFNNYIDRHVDKKMSRTKERALAQGLIAEKNALLFGTVLGILGGLTLYLYTNLLTLLVAAFGFFVYVILYSMWKCRTIYGTAIGSVAGAVPPVVGYCAVSNQFDLGAMILFTMLVLWQMPHFFSIALYRIKDYSAAEIPVLPVMRGAFKTKVHMALYIAAFTAISLLLYYFGYTGKLYLSVTLLMSLAWFILCLKGFQSVDDEEWGGKMFRLSLVAITAISIAIPFEQYLH